MGRDGDEKISKPVPFTFEFCFYFYFFIFTFYFYYIKINILLIKNKKIMNFYKLFIKKHYNNNNY